MKKVVFLAFVFVLFGCTSTNHLYSNYQMFKPKKNIFWYKEFKPIEIIFTSVCTGYMLDYRNINDTIIQSFDFKIEKDSCLVITNYKSSSDNHLIPLGNDTLFYVNGGLLYYPEQIIYDYLFYRKKKSQIIHFQ